MKDSLDTFKKQNQGNLKVLSDAELNIVFGGVTEDTFTDAQMLLDVENPYDGRKQRPNE